MKKTKARKKKRRRKLLKQNSEAHLTKHAHTKENENGKRKDCDESLPITNKGNEEGMKNDVRKTRTKEDGGKDEHSLRLDAGVLARATSGKKDGHDGAVETKRLRENEDEHHGDVHARLLGDRTHTSVASNADRHTRSNTTETDSQTGRKVKEAGQKAVAELDCLREGKKKG